MIGFFMVISAFGVLALFAIADSLKSLANAVRYHK